MKFYLVMLILLLSACDVAIEPSSDYQKRIQNVLSVDVSLEKSDRLRYPRQRLLVKQDRKKKNSISIREFLSLRECKLHLVLAQRNSLIGKVAPASQLMFNDLQILEYIPECIEQLVEKNNTLMAQKLESYFKLKQSDIMNSLWKAILGSSENASFWQEQPQPENYPLSLNQESNKDIVALIQFVEKVKLAHYHFSKNQVTDIEQNLKALQNGDGGYLLKKMTSLEKDLNLANKAIQLRIDRPLCLNSKPTQKAYYFKNVVNLYFIEKVQMQAVHLIQRYRQLMKSYLKLELALQSGAPLNYRKWKQERDQQFELSLNISKKHAGKVQLLFNQCGLTVGR